MPQSYSNNQQNLSFTNFDKQSEVTVFNSVNSLKISSSHSSLVQELVVPNPDSEFDIIDSLDYDDDDDAVFVDQEIVYQRRELLIQELYHTEKDYVKNVLQALQNVYILPLRKNTKQSSFSFLGMKKPPCTEREIFWLFGNLEELLEVHKSILNDLEERFSIWGPTQIMSDIILTWFPKMQKIYRVYLDHYSIAVSTFERLSRYQPFKKFLESVEKDSEKGRDLLSLLRAPNTCILRYAKILTSLADNTSSMHPDYIGLLQCKQRVEQLFEEFRHK
ncbi:hypothetical protein G6F46_003823 [Rhizopus delemar]|uniref:DH domain-containing protein n=2 Tax=Rhizopus TaxID=4842 RepID=A0A9P6Z385_9FUNG|nr:hypothetical protein G6F55_008207 [Rhizopus delemar]KAG1549554.1 hypothetical protein G6F51_002987 [Rhizopus arrhizus]KAG1504311.1 hypothetical protein G6F54_001098 [Rhizopus delemar]KAG1516346.1 hypothetical protein G6F53_002234 [Rhizopus delemar]KAG1522498.1 hypothetical protein G6F52_005807 [Rhizopus delemar]